MINNHFIQLHLNYFQSTFIFFKICETDWTVKWVHRVPATGYDFTIIWLAVNFK